MNYLLAVDIGIKTGVALYRHDGRLVWYRSHNLGTRTRLRRWIYGLLNQVPELVLVVLEGGGDLANIWVHTTRRLGIETRIISAETWRQELLYSRQQRNSVQAKLNAEELARRIIRWSNAPSPTSLRHDAAEAIVVGLWGVLQIGWLKELPNEMQR